MKHGITRKLAPLAGLAVLVVVCAGFLAPSKPTSIFLHAPYSTLLRAHVRNGTVDYAGLKAQEKRLDAYLGILGAADPEDLDPREQMAFFINAYNAWTLKVVLNRYPKITSIKDTGTLFSSPWKVPVVRLMGRVLTLDHLENEILRPRFRDPRVHFALSCASRSCPPLRPEPYEGQRLDAQLDDAARSFINDARFNAVEGKVLRLNKIFDWYADDFGGPKGVLGFVRRYADTRLARELDALGPAPSTASMPYDWGLNGR